MCLISLSVTHVGEFAKNFYLLDLVKNLCVSWISYAKGHIVFLGVFRSFWEAEKKWQERSEFCKTFSVKGAWKTQGCYPLKGGR